MRIRFRVMIGRELDERGITTPAGIGKALGMSLAEAPKLLTPHQWREGDLLRAATDQCCPFDLHRLLPVPPAILRLGPEDPQSQAWLWRHWGTTCALRHIRLLPSPADRRNSQTDHWPALWTLRRAWPDLTLSLRPH